MYRRSVTDEHAPTFEPPDRYKMLQECQVGAGIPVLLAHDPVDWMCLGRIRHNEHNQIERLMKAPVTVILLTHPVRGQPRTLS
jgi:hypothetical protein